MCVETQRFTSLLVFLKTCHSLSTLRVDHFSVGIYGTRAFVRLSDFLAHLEYIEVSRCLLLEEILLDKEILCNFKNCV